jgi:hypothetical protein
MRAFTVGVLAWAVALTPALAAADRYDFTLERIIGPPAAPGMVNDPNDVVRQSQYKSLMSEMSVVIGPHYLTPADTLGYSGFQMGLETSFSQITNTADYWQKGVENPTSSFLPTLTVMARKGLWLPLPGFELGVGGTKLFDSSLYALQAYAKLGLHEGYHGWPIPSLAVRGAVSHLLGTSEVNLTVMSLDATLSKSFGIGGVVTLDPYIGAAALLSFVRGEVIDTTPGVDAYAQGPTSRDINANTTFPDPDTIVRWRTFAGFRLLYGFFALTGEFVYTFCNDSASGCGKVDAMKVTDRSLGQVGINFSGSLVF